MFWLLIRKFRLRAPEFREKTFNMLTKNKTWDEFSNHGVGEGTAHAESLEAVHGSIHDLIGEGAYDEANQKLVIGHMGRVPYAGRCFHPESLRNND